MAGPIRTVIPPGRGDDLADVPLDKDTMRLLEALRAAPPMDLLSLPPEQARLAARAALFTADPGKPVRIHDERIEVPGQADVPVRVYQPVEPAGPVPALLYLHGGGWLVGDLDTIDHLCRAIAHDAGCVVVSADYRLAPEHPYPAGLRDAEAALGWLAEQSGRLGFDPALIAVGGDSAGANLATALCLRVRDMGGPPVALQLLAYPVADHRFDTASYLANAEGFLLTRKAMMGYWERYLARPEDGDSPYTSVLRADLSGLPPAFILTASHDPLRDEGEALAHRMSEAAVRVRCTRFNGTIHGFLVRFPLLRVGRVALAAVVDVLRAITTQPRIWPTRLIIEEVGPLVYSADSGEQVNQANVPINTEASGA
ncbi:MAG TPA: alpha/beta hydrolase [Micromonosporaceae bacterium]